MGRSFIIKIMRQIIHEIRKSKQYKEFRKFLIKYTYGIIRNWVLGKLSKEYGGVLDFKEYGIYTAEEVGGDNKAKSSVDLGDKFTIQNQLDFERGSTMCAPTSGSMILDVQ